MHFSIHIEDVSGEKMVDILMPKIIMNSTHTYRVHSYKGIGTLPKKSAKVKDVKHQALLNDLPRIL